MDSTNPPAQITNAIAMNAVDRWSAYHRLQQLSIPCQCAQGQPLQVQIGTAIAAIQLWSVLRQITASRQEQIAWLEHCWQQASS